jgi:uncharacterized HhH-GPD family protein
MALSFLRRFWGDFVTGLKQGYGEDAAPPRAKRGARGKAPGVGGQTAEVAESTSSKRSTARLRASNKIADAILASEPFSLDRPPSRISHTAYAKRVLHRSRFITDEKGHANAFLFGVISDRMIKAEQAWALPYHLADRLGHLDVERIRKMRPAELEKVLTGPPALHRFNRAMAEAFIEASERLVTKWKGSAANIWPDGSAASDVLAELESYKGISNKLSAMTLQILITQLGVRIEGLSDVNIAVDRHVARVFLRTGLVKVPPGRRVF